MIIYSIKTKIILVITVLVISIALTVGLFWGNEKRNDLLASYAVEMNNAAMHLQTTIQNKFDSVAENVKLLSNDQDLLDYVDTLDSPSSTLTEPGQQTRYLEHLQSRYLTLMAAKPEYFQVRFISAHDNGRELVRIDRLKSGELAVIPEHKLQRKGHRDYFIESIGLARNDIYFSRINLNVEHKKIEVPHKPTVRGATTVFNPQGELLGISIINVDLTRLISGFTREFVHHREHLKFQTYIANDVGYWLIHPEPDHSFGFDLDTDYRIQQEFPDYRLLESVDVNSEQLISSKANPDLLTLIRKLTIRYGSSERVLYVLFSAKESDIRAQQMPRYYQIALFTFIAGLAVLSAILWLIGRFIHPMEQLADTAAMISTGNYNIDIPNAFEKETRQLTNAIDQLRRDVSDREKRLQNSEARSNLLIESVPVGIVVVDELGIIIRSNQAMDAMFYYKAGQLEGKSIETLVPASSRSKHEELRSAYFEHPKNLLMSGTRHLQAVRMDGSEFPVEIGLSTLNVEGKMQVIATVQDLSDKVEAEKNLWHQANFDFLTGLPNRKMFTDLLDRAIKSAHRKERKLWLLFLDLDGFKEINDSHGHEIGDKLLVEVAERMQQNVRETDVLARLGGDEFVLIVSDASITGDIDTICNSLLQVIGEAYSVDSQPVFITASIGISCYPEDALNATDLMRFADQSMYAAKSAGRNRYFYFTPAFQYAAEIRTQIATDLHRAVVQNEFQLLYQPIIDLHHNRVIKTEALIRWNHPDKGVINPAAFIPIAEETGAINEIGEWIFKEVARQLSAWRDLRDENFQISVNVSPFQLTIAENRYHCAADQLNRQGIPSKNIVLEITEGLLLEKNPLVNQRLLDFRDHHIQVALDDFGTGYSSLAYLKDFDIDYLKIDRSFVENLTEHSSEKTLIVAIIAMAHKLGMKVIAEGIETEDQYRILQQLDCDFGQGYYISRPISAQQFTESFLLNFAPPGLASNNA